MSIGPHERTGISTFAFKFLQRLPQKGIRLLAYYRFFQIADYICGIELAATKYERETSTKTDGATRSSKREWAPSAIAVKTLSNILIFAL